MIRAGVKTNPGISGQAEEMAKVLVHQLILLDLLKTQALTFKGQIGLSRTYILVAIKNVIIKS